MVDRRLLTNQEVVDLIKEETGKSITVATFRSYVARGQAPAPVDRRANTPLFSRKQALEWMHNRPGSGARNDVAAAKDRTTQVTQASGSPAATPATDEQIPKSAKSPRKPARRRTAAPRT